MHTCILKFCQNMEKWHEKEINQQKVINRDNKINQYKEGTVLKLVVILLEIHNNEINWDKEEQEEKTMIRKLNIILII